MKKIQLFYILFFIFLLSDLTYSFLQYYNTPLFGDMEGGILPDNDVRRVIEDPFGINAIVTGEKHVNPNRFFSHYSFMKYFQVVPIFLQNFVDPIPSIYLSCAIMKILVQIVTIYLLSIFITNQRNIFGKEFLKGAIIIMPLFQAYGYFSTIGINDKSAAYTFFYAIPTITFFIFIIPLIKLIASGKSKIPILQLIPLVAFGIILPFSGPLVPGLLLIFSLLLFVHFLRLTKPSGKLSVQSIFLVFRHIPRHILLVLIPTCILSIYSLYLGNYDSNYSSDAIPIAERYLKLLPGFFSQLFHAFGLPAIYFVIGINTRIIYKNFNNKEGQRIIQSLKWIGFFILIYILLLPLGGYRPYRPLILRYDTTIPISLCLFYAFGLTSLFVLRSFSSKKRIWYGVILTIILLVFTIEDQSTLKENHCEKLALKIISESPNDTVCLDLNCKIMSWSKIQDYNQTKNKGQLLYYWNITDRPKLYYQKNE